MYIQLVSIQLRQGVDEHKLLEASDRFQSAFVSKQPGCLKRILLRADRGGYADLVFFASRADAEAVAQAESSNEHFLALLELIEPAEPQPSPMGIVSFEALKTYE